MPDMPKSKETGDKDDHDDNIDGPPLPLSSLRLFVPPLRLVSAALWQVVQQGDIMDYGLVEEFVTTVLEVVPDMMSYREKVQLAMGLRAKLVLELCESVQTVDLEAIQPHLSRIRAITNIEKMPDPEVEASESKFLELVRTLLDNPNKKIFFFKEVFPVEFGPMYDTALQTLMWEFLSRLEKLLPTPTFQETASWLRPAPSLLKECAQTVTQPHPLKTLLLHHRCHGHLFTNGRAPRSFSGTIRHSLKRSKCDKKCSLCGRRFVAGNDLMKHMRTHIEQSPHQCTKCGEGFEHLDDLQKHQQNECEEMNQQEVCEQPLEKDRVSRLTSADPKKCPLCHKTFTFQYLLRRHLSIYHKGKSLFKCSLCQKGFPFLSYYKKHQENKRDCLSSKDIKERRNMGPKKNFGHVIKRRMKCPCCLKAFVSHSQLKRHQENKRFCQIGRLEKNGRKQTWTLTPGENSKDIPQSSSLATEEPTTSYALTTSAHSSNKKTIPKACPICHKTFTYEATMIRHIASHQKESLNKCPDILKCNFCKEMFSRGMELKIHYSRVHQFTGPFPCPSCQNTFVSLSELSIHQRNEPMPYQCSVCQRFFRTQKTLTIHKRIHTGEKPFVCAECGKGFRIQSLLQSHSEIHVEGKPYACSACGRRFKREALLKQHMLHHKDASFVCPDCGKKFFQLTWLRRHMFMHTGERPFLCDVCGKGFKSRAELKLHTMTHTGEFPLKCPECGKGCRQKSELQRHRQKHTGERPYPCSLCDKRFCSNKDRKRHIITHTGEKPYKCQACGMAFMRRALLSVHQNRSCM
ncbi:zinc finger protein 493-like isoform X7 [Esox lucius]|uniref:zinc finger protein 493-like isoform X7 n=1 Tax=Esox lucius TaxID=8010 RepID=UPI001477697B|nr:zinc finger protein 493-like isoform X7 [Esox lucius]